MLDLYDYLGLVGVAFTIYNYARLQWQRDYAKKLRYSAGNFLGAALITVSLIDKWNLSAFVVNVIMAAISAYGIFRCLKYKMRERGLPFFGFILAPVWDRRRDIRLRKK